MKTTKQQGVLSRMPLSFMGWLTAGSLMAIGIGFWMLILTIGVTVVAIAIIAVASVVMAGLVFTGVRWTPALGAVFGAGVWIGGLSSQQYSLYHLTHPQEGGPFIVSVLIYVLAIVAIVAGSVATMQNYRGGAQHVPRWTGTFLGVMAGFVVGATVVSLLVLPGNTQTAQASTEPGTVHMGIASFSQSTATIAKGSMLKLVDDGSYLHIITNGTWDGTTPKPASGNRAPTWRICPALHRQGVDRAIEVWRHTCRVWDIGCGWVISAFEGSRFSDRGYAEPKPWGEYTFTVHDPDGHVLEFDDSHGV